MSNLDKSLHVQVQVEITRNYRYFVKYLQAFERQRLKSVIDAQHNWLYTWSC